MKTVALVFLFFSFHCKAQWSLQQCVDSMLVNNPKVRLAEYDISIKEIEHKSEKWDILPTINANASHGYNWGQTIDLFTNQFATNRVQYNNFSLSSSITLFNGLRSHYSKKIAGVDLEIAKVNQQIERRNATIDVISSYLQVLLNQEIKSIRESQLSETRKELERIRTLNSKEYETNTSVLRLEAQKSNDEYQLVLSANDLRKSLILLQETIGQVYDSTFSISDDVKLNGTPKFNPNEINQLNLAKQQFQVKRSNSTFYPTISLYGSMGSGYSENNKILNSNGQLVPKRFSTQLNENFYQSLSANLSIPIFTKIRNYNAPKIQKLELERVKIQNDERERIFANERLQRKIEVINNESALESAKKSLESFTRLFEEAKVLFETGNINFYEFSQSKEDYYRAKAEVVQAEYRLIFSILLRDLL